MWRYRVLLRDNVNAGKQGVLPSYAVQEHGLSANAFSPRGNGHDLTLPAANIDLGTMPWTIYITDDFLHSSLSVSQKFSAALLSEAW